MRRTARTKPLRELSQAAYQAARTPPNCELRLGATPHIRTRAAQEGTGDVSWDRAFETMNVNVARALQGLQFYARGVQLLGQEGREDEEPCGDVDEDPCGDVDEDPCGDADEDPCGDVQIRIQLRS